jgi:hypothetical protein
MVKLMKASRLAIALAFPTTWCTAALATPEIFRVTILTAGQTLFAGVNGAAPYLVYISQNDQNVGCNSSDLSVFAVDANTAAGRAMIATVLVAQATGSTISISGVGSFSVLSNVDTALGIDIP